MGPDSDRSSQALRLLAAEKTPGGEPGLGRWAGSTGQGSEQWGWPEEGGGPAEPPGRRVLNSSSATHQPLEPGQVTRTL